MKDLIPFLAIGLRLAIFFFGCAIVSDAASSFSTSPLGQMQSGWDVDRLSRLFVGILLVDGSLLFRYSTYSVSMKVITGLIAGIFTCSMLIGLSFELWR